ncbi:MAG: aldo/keto reductase [Oscillospiraceae bacterium]|nr:aldo/keto reductase [Oscillospiraceae bacterium]
MKKTVLGRTGLEVSVAGLGAGGHSRLGIAQYGLQHSAMIVKTAFENGVTYFDTATAYGTEEAVGLGLKGIPREQYVLSTKFPYRNEQGINTPDRVEQVLGESLRALHTDYIDIYNLHGVAPEDYEKTVDMLLPAMQKAQKQGKVRFLGITELFGSDTNHTMLKRALPDDFFDVIMLGYSIINPSAAKTIMPLATEKNVGLQCMFAVRKALSNPEQLKTDIKRILEKNQADPSLMASHGTLDFLVNEGAAGSIMEAAYRFCSNAPGIHITLTGTGNVGHLIDNLKAIQMPALPEDILKQLDVMFGNVDCVSGQ